MPLNQKYKDLRFEALFNSASMGIIVVNGKGDIVMSNHYANNLFGYQEDEIVEALYQFCFRNGLVDLDPNFLNKQMKIVDGIPYPILGSNMVKTYLNCAGKNFAGFDKKFLEKLPRWKQVFSIRSRVLDPGILYVNWINDESVPSLDECKKRAGIDGVVTHNAVEDAMDVVMLLRQCYKSVHQP